MPGFADVNMMKYGKKQNGFALAELLVAAAIIGVLAAVGIPVFTGLLNKARETSDLANERAAKAAAFADFYGNGYDIKSGGPLSGHYYQYEYDAVTGRVVLQIDANAEEIRRIRPYGHKYTLTKQDPVRMLTGWTEFKNGYSSGSYPYYNVGNRVDNTKDIITVIIYYDPDGSLEAAEWWLNPETADISNDSGQ